MGERSPKTRMTADEHIDNTLSKNYITHIYGTSPYRSDSAIAGTQRSDSVIAGAQTTRSNLANCWYHIASSSKTWSVLIGEVLARLKFKGWSWKKILGSIFNLGHFFSLPIYGGLGLSSRDKDSYSSIFVHGGSIITFFFYVVLYCADINKLTSSILEKGQGESKGAHWAKVGLMGIVLPVFNFTGLIVMFVKAGQDGKTFSWGILVFINYLLGNTLLFLGKGESTESEEHELRENNSTADNALVDNSTAANSSVDNSPVDNAQTANAPIDNSSVDSSPVDNLPKTSIRNLP
ncbi:uncharacterized protein ZBIST_5125 [Zygosaccharomyces bailii]|nr:uncharacterized protein ZBIST_5125 [Zygosaccharomyces bailii]